MVGKELNAGYALRVVKERVCVCVLMYTLNKTTLKIKKTFSSFSFIDGSLENSLLGLVHNSEVFPIRGRTTECPATWGQKSEPVLGPMHLPLAC